MKKTLSVIICLALLVGIFALMPLNAGAVRSDGGRTYFMEVGDTKTIKASFTFASDEAAVEYVWTSSEPFNVEITDYAGSTCFIKANHPTVASNGAVLHCVVHYNKYQMAAPYTVQRFQYAVDYHVVVKENETVITPTEPVVYDNGFEYAPGKMIEFLEANGGTIPGAAGWTDNVQGYDGALYYIYVYPDVDYVLPYVVPPKPSSDNILIDFYGWSSGQLFPKDAKVSFSREGLLLKAIFGYAIVEPTEEPDTQQLLCGDADGDGAIAIFDATAIQRKVADLSTTAFVESAADADGDGSITVLDATAIQRHLAGLSANEKIGKSIT